MVSKNNRNGFVLSLVLWISAALMLLVLVYVKLTKEEASIYKQLHTKLDLELAVESMFERLSFYLATGRVNGIGIVNTVKGLPKQINLDNTQYSFVDQNQDIECRFSLLDDSGLFKLKHLFFVHEVEKMIKQSEHKKYSFADLYMDWIDADNFTRVNGAEESDYLLDGYKYRPANYNSFQHISSVCLLKGFCHLDEQTKANVMTHMSVYGYRPLNILLIDKMILKSIFPDYSEEEITNLLQLKRKNFAEYTKMFDFLPYDAYGTGISKIIRITITCTQTGKDDTIISRKKAIVDYRAFKNRSWTLFETQKF